MSETLALCGVRDLDLAQTLDCGQCFRWVEQPDGSFTGVAFGKSAAVRLKKNTLYIETENREDEPLWRSYFDLDLDYASVRSELSKLHPVLAEAAEYAGVSAFYGRSLTKRCVPSLSRRTTISSG